MNFQFSNPYYLFLLPPAVLWVIWLAWKSDVHLAIWRRWTAFFIRLIIVLSLILAVAGFQWKLSMEGVNVFFLLDRSDSVPSPQQEAAREWVNKFASQKKLVDKAGVLVFGSEASIESSVTNAVDVKKIYSVVSTERSDISSAIRLGTAAFPETGQRRLVLFSDGNENAGSAMEALLAAKPLGVSIDVVPLGVNRGNDISVQKLTVPSTVKKGQTFDVKIFAQADEAQSATVQLFRNAQQLGEQKVELVAGKNLFTFPQTLTEPGFYSYNIQLNGPGDLIPQNNRATSFTSVRGNPRILIVSAEPKQDVTLAAALQDAKLDVKVIDSTGFPGTLAEMQSYDAIFLSNISAGELGDDSMKLLESAVRDFGVGLVCIGGDQTYAAGGYRGTPLESTLPVDMELNSKKVLPSGALVIVCHATEFPNGNQWARDIAFAALDALGPQDEMGIVLWDGNSRWLYPLEKVGDKKAMGKMIAGMNPGDMIDFGNPMKMAHEALKKSPSNLKHMVVFSDGDPSAPSKKMVEEIVGDKITISTVMIGGHVTPETMTWMADMGRGRFYDVRSPAQLPQIFLKEAAIILKSAIFEEPFKPQLAANSELIRGIGSGEYPQLKGYVCTTPKPRAEVPLVSDKGDPVLAHWQYGLGRSVAFTSDAKAKWAADWLGWDKYRQFWSQIAQWSLRKIENADFTSEVSVDRGEGHISVEAVDTQGNYRNFLNLQTTVSSPKGDTQVVRLEQTGPGHYEARFPTKQVGAYLLNLADMKDGVPRATQVLGASVNYSPEFSATEPNLHLLRKLTETGEGKILDPETDNPFLHDRKKTFQPKDLWEWLMKLAILLFPLDVAIRRVQLDWDEMARFFRRLQFWKKAKVVTQDESLSSLLARRDEVRARQTGPTVQPSPDLFKPEKPFVLPAKEAVTATAPTVETAAKTGASKPEETASTTSRLLDAKKRAKKNLE
ncbi:MAG: putative rane protein [Verrucomicrobiales bacterium]|nr:putative rane protein [Verrucomicrobiales bacterium]